MKLAGCLTCALLLMAPGTGLAQSATITGSLRDYNFLRLQDAPARPDAPRDVNLLTGRAISEVTFGEHVRIETHAVLDLAAPGHATPPGVATASQSYLPLTHAFVEDEDLTVTGRFDRLNVRVRTSSIDVRVGRQAITWGVNTLYPSLDVFAPYLPTQIDRDYKAGVDAVRIVVSPSSRLELDLIGAQLDDGPLEPTAAGAMVRLNAGAVDIGIMAGSFHDDTTAGGFVSMNVAGTGLRGEVSHTTPGDPIDRLRRPSFWRAGIGVDRQLTSEVSLSAEVAYNGFGERRVQDYLPVLTSARYQRGELPGLAQWAAGGTLTWKFHPLGTLSTLTLVNLNDGSNAVVPIVYWSMTSRLDLLGGVQVLSGRPPVTPGVPLSEYGGLGTAIVSGLKIYF